MREEVLVDHVLLETLQEVFLELSSSHRRLEFQRWVLLGEESIRRRLVICYRLLTDHGHWLHTLKAGTVAQRGSLSRVECGATRA